MLYDKPLLVDLKIADIGFRSSKSWNGTNAKILAKLAGVGATYVTVHGFPGPSSINEAVGVGNELGIRILLLPMMSHVGAETFFSRPLDVPQFQLSCENSGINPNLVDKEHLKDVTDGILWLGEAVGVAGYIGPATRPEDLRRYRLVTQKPIWCPGFGRQDRLGRSLNLQFRDWANIVGSSSAAIVGSSIYKSQDPYAAANEMIEIRDSVTGKPSN